MEYGCLDNYISSQREVWVARSSLSGIPEPPTVERVAEKDSHASFVYRPSQ